jgi:NADH:ubiquinone oxidoreductase subunit F (NADH-binding)
LSQIGAQNRNAGHDRDANLALIADLAATEKLVPLCAYGGFTSYPIMIAIRHRPEDFGQQE